jgi:pimeloyl-ACP methyl ester carboxylesterase
MTRQPDSGRLARAMQAVLALELGLLGAGLGALWYNGTISGKAWLLIAAGWYLGFRALALAKNFLQTQLSRSPRVPGHQLGPFGTLRLLWGEYWPTLIVYSFLFPFEARLVPLAPKAAAAGSGTPIVLVPGFCCNRGYWALFVRWLRQAGLGPVYAVTLEPLLGSIEANAAALRDFVEAVCAETKSDKVILIGHSMGGLVGRQYLHAGGAARIAQLICLGSPHHGTVIAEGIQGLGENLRQMSPGSAWAAQLNTHERAPCPVPVTSIVTPHDNIVAPQDSALLHYPNARNVILPGVGHLEMPVSRTVFSATLAALQEAR